MTNLHLTMAFYIFLAMDVLHTLIAIYSYLPEGGPSIATSTAVRRRFLSTTFLLLELPSWVLPIAADAIETDLSMPMWTLLIGVSQLLVFVSASDGFWWLLVVCGGFWWLLVASGGFLLLPVAYDCFRLLPIAPDCRWVPSRRTRPSSILIASDRFGLLWIASDCFGLLRIADCF